VAGFGVIGLFWRSAAPRLDSFFGTVSHERTRGIFGNDIGFTNAQKDFANEATLPLRLGGP
jgi:hypothetical protein